MLTDKFKCPSLAVLVGLSLHLLALLVKDGHSQMAIILAGIGSATFHVGGGSLALTTTPYQTIGSGLFTAPGIIGLAVGGVLGFTGNNITIPIVLLLGLIIGLIAIINFSKYDLSSHDHTHSGNEPIENANFNDGVLLVLLIAIALTSTVWTSFQFILKNHFNIIIMLAFATAITKVYGGVFAQLWGWRSWTIVSLTIAAFLLLFGQQNHLTLILGLALLQSTIPITLAATAKIMPQQPATATGFALGLSILIGGIPVIAGLGEITSIPTVSALIVMITTLSLWWVLKSKIILSR
jgi:FSR family fosmidomycin resistance protein-like MFS transporter